MKRLRTNESGAMTLAVTLVVFLAGLALASVIALVGIGELISGFRQAKSDRAFAVADGCMNEALLRLARDAAYAGGALSVGEDSCTIGVSGSEATRTITAAASSGVATRRITVDASLEGGSVTIDSWNEY